MKRVNKEVLMPETKRVLRGEWPPEENGLPGSLQDEDNAPAMLGLVMLFLAWLIGVCCGALTALASV